MNPVKTDEIKKDSQESFRKRTRLYSNATNSEKNLRIQELLEQIQEEKNKQASLENRLSEVHHEMALKSIEMEERIMKLKEILKKTRNKYNLTAAPIKELEIVEDAHNRLQGSVREILKEASDLAASKENEIIKNFDEKLSNICAELEEKRKKKNLEITLNKEKDEKYKVEAEMLKASASYIENKNRTLEEQNKQLRVEFSIRESETETLKKRLQGLKHARNLRNESQTPYVRFRAGVSQDSSASRSTSSDATSQRYDSIVNKLKQLIEIERNNLRAAKTAYTAEMEYKTEIEKLLRSCVEDVKQEILKKKSMFKRGEAQDEKKVILDELLTIEDLLNRIYDRAYPKSLLKR
jgi:uncharacterized protein YlxP (DUF503 family)